MSASHSKESDISPLSHIGLEIEHHSSVVDSACYVCQNKPGSIPSQAEFVTAALP